MQDVFLTTKELAQRWKVSESTLAHLRMESKEIPFYKLGRSVRYKLSDIIKHEEGSK